ncbi:MAG: aldose epimerase family protein [Treponema sp.]
MHISKKTFGILPTGKEISLFTVSNGIMSFSAIDYGCCITSILLPRANNTAYDDIVLGYSSLDGYVENAPHFGSIIGRYAGRIENACFPLNGVVYSLSQNDGSHCLHGGYPEYDKQVWEAESFLTETKAGIRFSRISPDGEQGFPALLRITVSYILDTNNTITLHYEAEADAATPVNLTNHTYFNLNTPVAENGTYVSALNHWVKIYSSQYVETDSSLIPTGQLLPVENTAFDFRTGKTLTADFDALENGYDDTWLLDHRTAGSIPLAAIVREPNTGRELHIFSTQPALTMYTANFLQNDNGKNGYVYGKHSAICFETQHIPNSPNRNGFPSTIIAPDKKYCHKTLWHFKL